MDLGAVYGLAVFAVFAVSSLVLLPIAAAITDSGDAITRMARMVGWPTFALGHIVFGVVLGAVILVARERRTRERRPNRVRDTPSRPEMSS